MFKIIGILTLSIVIPLTVFNAQTSALNPPPNATPPSTFNFESKVTSIFPSFDKTTGSYILFQDTDEEILVFIYLPTGQINFSRGSDGQLSPCVPSSLPSGTVAHLWGASNPHPDYGNYIPNECSSFNGYVYYVHNVTYSGGDVGAFTDYYTPPAPSSPTPIEPSDNPQNPNVETSYAKLMASTDHAVFVAIYRLLLAAVSFFYAIVFFLAVFLFFRWFLPKFWYRSKE